MAYRECVADSDTAHSETGYVLNPELFVKPTDSYVESFFLCENCFQEVFDGWKTSDSKVWEILEDMRRRLHIAMENNNIRWDYIKQSFLEDDGTSHQLRLFYDSSGFKETMHDDIVSQLEQHADWNASFDLQERSCDLCQQSEEWRIQVEDLDICCACWNSVYYVDKPDRNILLLFLIAVFMAELAWDYPAKEHNMRYCKFYYDSVAKQFLMFEFDVNCKNVKGSESLPTCVALK